MRKLSVEEHEKNCHADPKMLFEIIQEKCWLIKATKTLNAIIYLLVTCKKLNTKPIETPFAPLPTNKVNDAEVFEIVGVYLAGPLYLKGSEKMQGSTFRVGEIPFY